MMRVAVVLFFTLPLVALAVVVLLFWYAADDAVRWTPDDLPADPADVDFLEWERELTGEDA